MEKHAHVVTGQLVGDQLRDVALGDALYVLRGDVQRADDGVEHLVNALHQFPLDAIEQVGVGALGERFWLSASDKPVRPAGFDEFSMYLANGWHRLTIRPDLIPENDPIGRLPITLLTRNAIEPLFGITEPRTDKRIDFVGGARGLIELERRVKSGEMSAAFALYPTQIGDLMSVADAGAIMPPKSTWFEPKLADGMVSHVLD